MKRVVAVVVLYSENSEKVPKISSFRMNEILESRFLPFAACSSFYQLLFSSVLASYLQKGGLLEFVQEVLILNKEKQI